MTYQFRFSDDCEVIRGRGNVFRDSGYPNADVHQAKALLAAQIIRVLDEEGLSTCEAQAQTGIAHSEFVRIRRVNLGALPSTAFDDPRASRPGGRGVGQAKGIRWCLLASVIRLADSREYVSLD